MKRTEEKAAIVIIPQIFPAIDVVPPHGAHAGQAEKDARPIPAGLSGPAPQSISSSNPAPVAQGVTKLRSCVIYRRRKIRCDKLSPCTNCRLANIACVVPSANDKPPRWAHRLERDGGAGPVPSNAGVNQVMERLRTLESLVEELNGQLEQARASANRGYEDASSASNQDSSKPQLTTGMLESSSSTAGTSRLEKPFGRMMLQDSSRSRYVSNGFWSRISDEIDGLKMDARELGGNDSDSSDDEDSPGQTLAGRRLNATHYSSALNVSGTINSDLSEFRPLPSQIPFLLDVFSENVNYMLQAVHMPSIMSLSRNMRNSDTVALDAADEALMFSISYAAVTSTEEDDVLINFGTIKAELNMKFRLGLEHGLAKADFLNMPQLKLVQALSIFLYVARRHDSPRFIWMMTGLAIRMARAIGLHRDGPNFPHMTPFEAEMRRRAWCVLCTLDIRTSKDQGMELSIAHGSFDTKLPLDVNEDDLFPEMTQLPPERDEITDMSGPLGILEQCILTRKMMSPEVRDSASPLQEQARLLDSTYEKMSNRFLKYGGKPNIMLWVGVTATRLVVSKMTLFNDEKSCRQWRWVYQSYTHWNAIVYLLLEISRRPWTLIAERMWISLHSKWLIPADPNMDKGSRMWIPLRKLMAKARRHRDAEAKALAARPRRSRAPRGCRCKDSPPSSPLPFPSENSEELFRQHWHSLIIPDDGDISVNSQEPDTKFTRADSSHLSTDYTPGLASQQESASRQWSGSLSPYPTEQQDQPLGHAHIPLTADLPIGITQGSSQLLAAPPTLVPGPTDWSGSGDGRHWDRASRPGYGLLMT
ncbi:Fungal trans [Geosmithia morbida]|uniref:Fungal trans n=1 Tax=Geosmithia morbida TaxID=1094350 RepID=A0A9P5D137_9HYPO|nr:Fungal trans [Geosmithia morbida]KAF4120046.1 Fungal trans [Geosmithia morbida]